MPRALVRACLLAVVFLGAALMASHPAGAQGTEPRMQDLRRAQGFHQRGARALQRGDFERAERDFSRALEIVPDFPESLAGLGHIAMREKRFEEALERYLGAESGFETLSSQVSEFRMLRWLDAQDSIQNLSDYLSTLKEQESKIQMGLTNTGSVPPGLRSEILKVERRIRDLESVPEPGAERGLETPSELQFFIGNAYFHLERMEDALGRWERCARAMPDFAPVYNNLAVAYMSLGRRQRALDAAARAEELGIVLNPNLKRDLETLASAETPDKP